MQMLFPTKAVRDNGGPAPRRALLCRAKEQRALGDGRPIAPSMGTEAVISAARPDSISHVRVPPLMFPSPLLSSRLISSPPPGANPGTAPSARPALSCTSSVSSLILVCPPALQPVQWKLFKNQQWTRQQTELPRFTLTLNTSRVVYFETVKHTMSRRRKYSSTHRESGKNSTRNEFFWTVVAKITSLGPLLNQYFYPNSGWKGNQEQAVCKKQTKQSSCLPVFQLFSLFWTGWHPLLIIYEIIVLLCITKLQCFTLTAHLSSTFVPLSSLKHTLPCTKCYAALVTTSQQKQHGIFWPDVHVDSVHLSFSWAQRQQNDDGND